jgi:hypothetical protein
MKPKSLLTLLLMVFSLSFSTAQDLPPKHRGSYPHLQADGKVIDKDGKQLGYITKNGKICDVTGRVIGIIAETGEVSYANGKGVIGVIQKDGSFKSKKGNVVTTGGDGTVTVAGKGVASVEKKYKNKSHGCALHCFFSDENEDADKIDEQLNQ